MPAPATADSLKTLLEQGDKAFADAKWDQAAGKYRELLAAVVGSPGVGR